MESAEIRKKFLEFFKKRGHVVVPSSSLIPDDPSVLLTTAGMQQFKRYYTGELDARKDFRLPDGAPAKGVASIQKCFRTSDIDEVGDESHLTFFEMLGNFSFGGYFKEEAIRYAYEFITGKDWMGLAIDHVSIFEGGKEIPADGESEKIWKAVNPGIRVVRAGREDNFWGPTGAEGPCGPTTEIYCKNAGGKSVEIWNLVFNQYYQHADGRLEPLATPGVDTGMGLERLAMVSQGAETIFKTDLFAPILKDFPPGFNERQKRIIADHARAVAFLIADGIRPSNKEQGYVLRRLMRRMIVQHASFEVGLGGGIDMPAMLGKMVELYRGSYSGLEKAVILGVFDDEVKKYGKALEKGMKEVEKMKAINAEQAFYLYESFGVPYEAIKDVAGDKAKNLSREAFDSEFKKHQDKSRAGAGKKFGGHGLVLDTGELKAGNDEEVKKVLRLHTATHLLQQALREVLGPEVHQMGSDITPERTRFDFSFPRKVTADEVKKAEDIVNEKIKEDLPVGFKEMQKDEAERSGALHFFKEKYPGKVKVYYVGPDLAHAWSREFCGGPHVTHTGEIGHFRIAKEEAVGAGVRRIRGVLDN